MRLKVQKSLEALFQLCEALNDDQDILTVSLLGHRIQSLKY